MGDRLAGKTALVTGGGSGLGEATAKRFAEEGARVHLTDINLEGAQRVAAEIGDAATAHYQDVTDEAGWDALMETILAEGPLHVVVNNAGIVISASVEDATLDDWRRTQAVNLDAVFLGTRAAVKAMKHSGGGSIINISSIEGLVGEPKAAAYNASKGGVRIFTKSAALHCGEEGYNIRVNSVHPGFILTPMVEQGLADVNPDDLEAVTAHFMSRIPLGQMGDPRDIANGCLFLASDESRYMTGAELVIDGGFTAH
ncbi:MAG: glucose 1-dehydrogenase [Halieaceae bacterium]|jgi:NAD(P)-dependent dehydrogenase (short-subunit alcohol dehydrogenase family)|nr:glucose 1-dehydrogenase [Halieaceae bacterium]